MSIGDEKLDNDGNLVIDESGVRMVEGVAGSDPCCTCACGCPQALDALTIAAIPCMPCQIRVSLKEICSKFCWNQTPDDLYNTYFGVDGYRFQFLDWDAWQTGACSVGNPTQNPPFNSYSSEFPFYIPLMAYQTSVGSSGCDCPELYDNIVYFGAASTCPTNMYHALKNSSKIFGDYDPVPSAYMAVTWTATFENGDVHLVVQGEIIFPGLYSDIGQPYFGCVNGFINYNRLDPCILFDGTMAIPGSFTDGSGNIINPAVITNDTDTIVTNDGKGTIDDVNAGCDTGGSDAGCDGYTANCCQTSPDYGPCTGSDADFTPSSWTVTVSGITTAQCVHQPALDGGCSGTAYVAFKDGLGGFYTCTGSACVGKFSFNDPDGNPVDGYKGALSTNFTIYSYCNDAACTGLGSPAGTTGPFVYLWYAGGKWKIWLVAPTALNGGPGVSSDASFFLGEFSSTSCTPPLTFSNSQTVLATAVSSQYPVWGTGGSVTATKCC